MKLSYSVFLGVAMENKKPVRLEFVEDLVKKVESKFRPVFYAPRVWPMEKDYPQPAEALNEVVKGLKASQLFVLYYPDKVVSGALVELGMAIGLGMPVFIYTEKNENITYFLRDGGPSIVVSNNPDEIWPWICKQLVFR